MVKVLGKDYKHVYAIIRVDYFQGTDVSLEDKIRVTNIVWTKEEAISGVERLNKLNADKDCKYFWQMTRLKNL